MTKNSASRKRVILLTGDETRHRYFRRVMALSAGIEVVASYCESQEKGLETRIAEDCESSDLLKQHAQARKQSEQDFFAPLLRLTKEDANSRILPKGQINHSDVVQEIINYDPDLLLCYGSSLIRSSLLEQFHGRFLNVHLGLSPYYRGSGTNIWPLINAEPEYIGATFMHIDKGIDTGKIIHQIRARIFLGDSPHQIGNRLISDMCEIYATLAASFDRLELPTQPDEQGKLYRRSDFNNDACERLYAELNGGLIERSLSKWQQRCAKVPLVQNPVLMDERS